MAWTAIKIAIFLLTVAVGLVFIAIGVATPVLFWGSIYHGSPGQTQPAAVFAAIFTLVGVAEVVFGAVLVAWAVRKLGLVDPGWRRVALVPCLVGIVILIDLWLMAGWF